MNPLDILHWITDAAPWLGGALGVVTTIAGVVVRFGLGPIGLIPFIGPALGTAAEAVVSIIAKAAGVVADLALGLLRGIGRLTVRSWDACCDKPITFWVVFLAFYFGSFVFDAGGFRPWVTDLWRSPAPIAAAAEEPMPTQVPDLFKEPSGSGTGSKQRRSTPRRAPARCDSPLDACWWDNRG